jgi:hypothetical protein
MRRQNHIAANEPDEFSWIASFRWSNEDRSLRNSERTLTKKLYPSQNRITDGWKQIDMQDLWRQPGSLASRAQRHFGEIRF